MDHWEEGTFRGAVHWEVEVPVCPCVASRPEKGVLPDGLGFRAVYQHKHGHFTTVTRVVAASPGGLPKVIISYALEALPKEKRMDPEPWKAEELRNLMRLSRLRVGVLARQLVTFGFSSAKDDLPEAPEENSYFPQYVPTRGKCATPSFTVTWVKKVTALRPVPSRIWADPPPLLRDCCGMLESMILLIPTEWHRNSSGRMRSLTIIAPSGFAHALHEEENALFVPRWKPPD